MFDFDDLIIPTGFAYFKHHFELPEAWYQAIVNLAVTFGTSYDSYLATEVERESLWLEDGAGFISFVRSGRYINVVGSLIAPDHRKQELVKSLWDLALANDLTVSVINVEERDVRFFAAQGFETTMFAQDYVVDLKKDISSGKRYRDLRQRINSIKDKGYEFRRVSASDYSPSVWRALVEELNDLERESLDQKIQKQPTQIFQGHLTAETLGKRHLYVAFSAAGQPDAFVICNPYRGGEELGLETYRYRVGSSAYVLRALVYHVMLHLKAEGACKLSLGVVPGLGCTPSAGESRITRGLLDFWVKNLGFVANIEGVYHFKQRFRPEPEPRYSCVTPRATIGSVYAFLKVWGGLNIHGGRFMKAFVIALAQRARNHLKQMRLKDTIANWRGDLRLLNKKQIALLVVGLMAPMGQICNSDILKGLGKLTLASPLPLVFTDRNGMEDFASKFFITAEYADGHVDKAWTNPEAFRRLKGTRGVLATYGAIFAFMPLIPDLQWHAIMDHGFCKPGPLLEDYAYHQAKLKTVTVLQVTKTKGRSNQWTRSHSC